MGCCEARPKRIDHNPRQQPSQSRIPPQNKQTKRTPQTTMTTYPQGIEPPLDATVVRIEVGKEEGSHTTTKSNRSVIQRYSIQSKEAAYRTPSIHTYHYQNLLEFNPSKYACEPIERFSMDRTLLNNNLSNNEAHNDPHSKLLVTKN